MLYRNGSGKKAALRPVDCPAPTIMFGARSNKVDWIPEDGDDVTWGYRNRPAPTVTGGGGKASGIELFDQQTRRKMLEAIESGSMESNGRTVNPKTPLDPIRVTPEEAATLQSYPVDFIWDAPMPSGKPVARTKQFLQIGNAVPPLLAKVVLEALWAPAPAAVIELFPATDLDAAA